METIDIKEMLDYFKNKILIIILVMILTGLIGCVYGLFIQVPTYQSSTKIILISNTQGTMSNSDVSLSQNLVSTYSEIVKSKRVLNQVISNLGLDYEYSKLSNKVSVSTGTNSQIIEITVTDNDKVIAKDIANDIAEVFVKEIPELYNISNVNILDTAEEATKPSNMSFFKQSALFLAVGAVLGVGIVFLFYYFDRSVKTKEQIEGKIGLPVIGTVQELKKGA